MPGRNEIVGGGTSKNVGSPKRAASTLLESFLVPCPAVGLAIVHRTGREGSGCVGRWAGIKSGNETVSHVKYRAAVGRSGRELI